MPEDSKPSKIMPKGKVKGGARFPRHSLADAIGWSRKLVSKTHSGAQPKDVVLSGVVNTRGTRGEIKISTLRQYGLLDGEPAGYLATELAKKLAMAPDGEATALLRQAAISPSVFRQIFNTYQGDTIVRGKVKQRAAELNVHPDESENCADIYLATMELAGLVRLNGEQVEHMLPDTSGDANEEAAGQSGTSDTSETNGADGEDQSQTESNEQITRPPRAVFNVNITLDSTLDTDKLESQLRVLRKYGAV